jgi:hypothetical protein
MRFAVSLTPCLAVAVLACGGTSDPAVRPEALQSASSTTGKSDSVRRQDPRTSISLPGPNYYPEGITVAYDGTFYVGSLGTGGIVRIPPRSTSTETFVPARPFFAVYGLVVDRARDLLWACTYDDTLPPAQPARLNAYQLGNGALAASYALPGESGFCNDVIVDRRGNVYATDSFANSIVRLQPGATELVTWATSPLFNAEPFSITLNGLVFDRSQRHLYVVRYDTGALFSIPVGLDGSAGEPSPIPVNPALEFADGIELVDDETLLVVENNVGRVSLVELEDGHGSKTVIASELLEPTTAALWGGSAWVAEGQLSHLFGDGQPTLPFQVKRVPIPER